MLYGILLMMGFSVPGPNYYLLEGLRPEGAQNSLVTRFSDLSDLANAA